MAHFYFIFLTKRKVGQSATPKFDNFYKNFQLNVNRKSLHEPIRSQCTLSLPPENIRKPWGFLMLSGGRERMHWERMRLMFIPKKKRKELPFCMFKSFTINNIKSINTGWIFIIKILEILKIKKRNIIYHFSVLW